MPFFHERFAAGILYLGLLFGARYTEPQVRIDLDSFDRCVSCTLRPVRFALLGDREGSGSVQGDFVRLSYDDRTREFLMYIVGGTTLQLFTRDGSFIRAFGSPGEGPGEFRTIRCAAYVNGTILVLDSGRSRWLRFTRDGRYLDESATALRPGEFIPIDQDTIVLGSVSLNPDAVGYPLHLATPSTGEIVRHFGSTSGEYNAHSTPEPYSLNVRVSVGPGGRSVLTARPNRLRIEEWSIGGALVRVIEGEPAWLRPILESPAFGVDPPPNLLVDFYETRNGILWTTAYAQDGRWREAITEARGEEPDPVKYRDLRIDAWDLQRGVHYGPHQWDQPAGSGLIVDGQFMFYRLEFDDNLSPRVVVYRFELNRTASP